MKVLNIKTSILFAAAALLAGCDENHWNDHELDGFEEPAVYSETQSITYVLTADDYSTLSTLSDNKALATTDTEAAALKAIGTNGCFASETEARKYLPAFLANSSFPYFTLNDGSSIKVSYQVSASDPEQVAGVNAGTTEYKVTEDDYIEAWGSDENYINGFAPELSASSCLPDILKSAFPSATAGQYVVANYNESATNPIFGTINTGEEGGEFVMSEAIKDIAVGDVLTASGVVTGISTRGFVLTDAAGSICYDSGSNGFSDENIVLGACVEVTGVISSYSRCLQIKGNDENTSYTVKGTTDYTYPTPVFYDTAMIEAACGESDNMLAQYVSFTGTASISGNYINVLIDSETNQGSVYYAPDYIKAQITDGETYTFTGYFVAVTSKGKYFNILVTGVAPATKSVAATRAEVGTVVTEGANAVYMYDGSKWSVPSNMVVLQPGDYTAMKQSYGNLSGTLPQTLLPIYLGNTYPYAQEEDQVTVVYKYYNGSSTAYTATQFTYTDGEWVMYNNREEYTDQFNRLKGTWVFDPSVTLTLPSGKSQPLSTLYYQACVDWVYQNIDRPLGSTSITSGVGYVTSYGNNEYYTGASAYQGNVDIRGAKAIEQYPDGYAGMSSDEATELMKTRFCYQVFPAVLATLHPDAAPIEGIEVLYTFHFTAYTGSSTEYTVIYKVTGPAQFEFISCDWWESGATSLTDWENIK